MTYSAAAIVQAPWDNERRAASGSRALGIVRSCIILGVGAVGFVGVSALAVTFTAAWMTGGTIQPQARLLSGPGSLALVPQEPAATKVARGQGGSQSADAYIDRSKPILPPEKMRPAIAQAKAAPVAAPAVPLPRPLPARLAQTRAEIEAPKPAVVAEAPVIAPAPTPVATLSAPKPVTMPEAKPERVSKHEAMAAIDARVAARNEATAPPKPAPVATIPVSLPTTLPESVSRTAVYDITGSTVHMPDGSKLVAQSGLGNMMNDPRHTKVRMRGPTPPNVYVLTERERLFHGVRAIRMNPYYKEKMHGRDGILAHSYMLGPNGQSNGCVSFKDYEKFLTAFLDGKVDKIVVVADLNGTSWKEAAMQADGINASPRRFAGGYSRPTIMPPSEITGGRSEPRTASLGSAIGAALGFASERGAGTW